MGWAKGTKVQESVDADKQDSSRDQVEVVIDIDHHGLNQSLNGEQMQLIVSSFATWPSLLVSLEKFILEAGIERVILLFKVRITALLDVPNVLHSLRFGNIV